jgi:3-hydroxyacyl-CoA dehydrogenase
VRLRDASHARLHQGLATIRRNYAVSVTRGRFTEDAVAERLGRIHPQLDSTGFDEVDLIIEAVFEDLALKQQVFRELDAVARPGCILASNTSTIDIDAIASATSRPADVVGLHFFSPANVMRLLEIVRGSATSATVIADAMALARHLGKVGVVVGNCPGFVGNRMLFPYMYEAQYLVEEGATPQQVDEALTAFGMAMGPFAVDDMAGIDVGILAQRALGHFSDGTGRTPLVQAALVEMGRLGQKTGKGWYTYAEDRKAVADPAVIDLIRERAAASGIPQRAFTSQEIVERTIYALVNEGARTLDEGFALRASDIDVVYVNGYGFPAWRGGPLFHADRVGLGAILDRITALHREHGPRWTPAPLLERLAGTGGTFRGLDAQRRG